MSVPFSFPDSNEYASYYETYIGKLRSREFDQIMNADTAEVKALLSTISEMESLHRYAEGKWTPREMIQHCIDTERIFSARALMFARGERQEIPGYDHEAYALASGANDRSNEDMLEEYIALRNSTIAMFRSFSESQFAASGRANKNEMSVRAIACIIPGHYLHHIAVLREKYGLNF
jgi:hypothetical protein